jgi:hypothetical protein
LERGRPARFVRFLRAGRSCSNQSLSLAGGVTRRKPHDGGSWAVESSNADEQKTVTPFIAEIQSIHQTFASEIQAPDFFRIALSREPPPSRGRFLLWRFA